MLHFRSSPAAECQGWLRAARDCILGSCEDAICPEAIECTAAFERPSTLACTRLSATTTPRSRMPSTRSPSSSAPVTSVWNISSQSMMSTVAGWLCRVDEVFRCSSELVRVGVDERRVEAIEHDAVGRGRTSLHSTALERTGLLVQDEFRGLREAHAVHEEAERDDDAEHDRRHRVEDKDGDEHRDGEEELGARRPEGRVRACEGRRCARGRG